MEITHEKDALMTELWDNRYNAKLGGLITRNVFIERNTDEDCTRQGQWNRLTRDPQAPDK